MASLPEFTAWLRGQSREPFLYFQGSLARTRGYPRQSGPATEAADEAWRAQAAGKVRLYQTRNGEGDWSYFAVKTRRVQ